MCVYAVLRVCLPSAPVCVSGLDHSLALSLGLFLLLLCYP